MVLVYWAALRYLEMTNGNLDEALTIFESMQTPAEHVLII